MKHRALIKLIICYLTAVVAMFVLLNYFGMHQLERHFLQTKVATLTEEADIIAEEYMTTYYRDSARLSDVLIQLSSMDRLLGTRTWMVNTHGLVLVDTAETNSAKGLNLDYIVPGFLDELLECGYMTEAQIDNVTQEDMLIVSRPIYTNFRLRGYVCLLTPMNEIRKIGYQYLDIINICFLIFVVILFAVFVVIYLITLQPIRHMTGVAKEYAKGRFQVKMRIHSHDEYRELANAIGYMADRFQNIEEQQKKFIGNISHDFRSPLTSIKGYAEAMADGTIPPELQKKYLDIILFETERLTKLTMNLLTLNRFDSTGALLELSAFDLNEVIRKTVLTFEGTCTKKRITLNLFFGGEELWVSADMGKIQQVLYNLIDNAIKFSNTDSSIDIRTEERISKIFVSIKDYGIGIPKESLNKIWERFYKTDLSRGKDKKGTGLGLSIVKEILEAHKEDINVVSTEGVGTEFSFTLPKAD